MTSVDAVSVFQEVRREVGGSTRIAYGVGLMGESDPSEVKVFAARHAPGGADSGTKPLLRFETAVGRAT